MLIKIIIVEPVKIMIFSDKKRGLPYKVKELLAKTNKLKKKNKIKNVVTFEFYKNLIYLKILNFLFNFRNLFTFHIQYKPK